MPVGTGSGLIWDNQGHIVTNFHVIRGAKVVKVTLEDKRTVEAKVVGAEPNKDVAVLKLDMSDKDAAALEPVTVGASSNLLVGQKVRMAGLASTVQTQHNLVYISTLLTTIWDHLASYKSYSDHLSTQILSPEERCCLY